MKKINIIQFMPYFPPHKWWLESVWEDISNMWISSWYWSFYNVIFDVWQWNLLDKKDLLKDKSWNIIWYRKDWYTVYSIPSFDLVFNFPFPKFWKKEYRYIKNELKTIVSGKSKNFAVISHTRFFLSAFLWLLFSKSNWLKYIHI